MQITVEIPDKLGKKFQKKFDPPTRKRIITQSVKDKIIEELELKADPFFKWAEKPIKRKEKDLARNHDKYLYEK